MANNNTVKLIGFLGAEAKVIESESKTFAILRLATADSYKVKETEEWKDKATIWHDVILFSPALIEEAKGYEKGARLEINGSLNYRDFKVLEDGKEFTKREASIIAYKVKQAPPKKEQASA